MIEDVSMNRVFFGGTRRVVLRCLTVALYAALSQWASAETSASGADASGSSATIVAVDQADAKKKLTCRREAVMGSNFKKKTCRTDAAIEAERVASRKYMEDVGKYQSQNPGTAQ